MQFFHLIFTQPTGSSKFQTSAANVSVLYLDTGYKGLEGGLPEPYCMGMCYVYGRMGGRYLELCHLSCCMADCDMDDSDCHRDCHDLYPGGSQFYWMDCVDIVCGWMFHGDCAGDFCSNVLKSDGPFPNSIPYGSKCESIKGCRE